MKRQEFITGVVGTFQTTISEDNRNAIPTSATITVFNPHNEIELISAQAMTVGSDGLLSYALTTTHTATVDENYKAEITYVLDGNTEYTPPIFFDVVYSILTSVITDDDVVKELPQITEKGYREYGEATSGSSTTIVNLELVRFPDDYWTGGLAVSLTLDEKREITSFVSATGTVTTTAFGTAISTDKYMLIRSYRREIDRALDKIRDRLQQSGKRYALITDSADLKELHLMFTIAEICKSFAVSNEDIWWSFWKDYEEKAENMFNNFKFKYDENEDSLLGEGEEDNDFGTARSFRA